VLPVRAPKCKKRCRLFGTTLESLMVQPLSDNVTPNNASVYAFTQPVSLRIFADGSGSALLVEQQDTTLFFEPYCNALLDALVVGVAHNKLSVEALAEGTEVSSLDVVNELIDYGLVGTSREIEPAA